MILRSKILGEMQVGEESILYLPDGLLGFEERKRFILAEVEEFLPFLWLISVDDPDLGFAIADPQMFYAPRYEIGLTDADKDVLDFQTGDTVSVFVILSTSDGGRRITADLKGPVVLNSRNRLGKQVVVYSPFYSVRQNLLAGEAEQVPVAGPVAAGRAAARG